MATGGAAIRKRSVVLAGHRTSVSLEDAFWDALKGIALSQGRSLNDIIGEVDRGRDGNLSSALRVYVLDRLNASRT
jgi:predicted DNA-binding ribbon-helix-helix protein